MTLCSSRRCLCVCSLMMSFLPAFANFCIRYLAVRIAVGAVFPALVLLWTFIVFTGSVPNILSSTIVLDQGCHFRKMEFFTDMQNVNCEQQQPPILSVLTYSHDRLLSLRYSIPVVHSIVTSVFDLPCMQSRWGGDVVATGVDRRAVEYSDLFEHTFSIRKYVRNIIAACDHNINMTSRDCDNITAQSVDRRFLLTYC